jgi:cyclic pyranopterin phosphate synthase
VRKNIVELVAILAQIDGVEDLSMTTNGVLLPQYAAGLKKAGLKRVNISLDTVNPEQYGQVTRLGDLSQVLAGIEAAQKAGLSPLKINCVLMGQPAQDTLALNRFL